MTRIPRAAKTQKERRMGSTVQAPIPNATKSIEELVKFKQIANLLWR